MTTTEHLTQCFGSLYPKFWLRIWLTVHITLPTLVYNVCEPGLAYACSWKLNSDQKMTLLCPQNGDCVQLCVHLQRHKGL